MELEATITYLIFNKEGQNIENKMYHKLNYWLKISWKIDYKSEYWIILFLEFWFYIIYFN